MGGLQERFAQFMQGRYGSDELNRTLAMGVIGVLVVCIVLNLFSGVLGSWAAALSSILNMVAMVGIVIEIYRALSRDHAKRSSENQRYLEWSRNRKAKKSGGSKKSAGKGGAKGGSAASARNEKDFLYLSCPHCKQEMRVPRGKGKIAVKCPKCEEKTIVTS